MSITVVCAVCRETFQATTTTKTCSERCWRLHKNDRQNRSREERRAIYRDNIARKRGKAPRLPVVLKGLPCRSCAHWQPCADSDIGGQCTIERFRVCNPLSPGAVPYAPVEVRNEA